MDYTRYRIPSHLSTPNAHNPSKASSRPMPTRALPRKPPVPAESEFENRPTSSPNRRTQLLGLSGSNVAVNLPSPQRRADLDDHASIPVVSDVSSQANPTILRPASVSSLSKTSINITSQTPSRALSSPGLASSQKPRGRPKGWKPGLSYNLLRSGTRDEINAAKQALPAHPKLTAVPSHVRRKHRQQHDSGRPSRAQPHEGAMPPNYSLKPKRRGRPPKKPDPPAAEIWARFVDPLFISFQCEWEGCQAELQNWDTLKKHLNIVHCRGEKMSCKWGRCGLARREMDASKGRLEKGRLSTSNAGKVQEFRTRKTFVTGEELRGHIDEAHLIPFLWHVGDGPRNLSGLRYQQSSYDQFTMEEPVSNGDVKMMGDKQNIPDYLFNDKGEQVTPWVKYQQLEDLHTYRENRRKLRELKAWLEDSLSGEDEDGGQPLEGA